MPFPQRARPGLRGAVARTVRETCAGRWEVIEDINKINILRLTSALLSWPVSCRDPARRPMEGGATLDPAARVMHFCRVGEATQDGDPADISALRDAREIQGNAARGRGVSGIGDIPHELSRMVSNW